MGLNEEMGPDKFTKIFPCVSLSLRIMTNNDVASECRRRNLFEILGITGQPTDDFDDLRGSSSIQTVRSALLRLASKGFLEKTDRGRFKQGMKPLFPSTNAA